MRFKWLLLFFIATIYFLLSGISYTYALDPKAGCSCDVGAGTCICDGLVIRERVGGRSGGGAPLVLPDKKINF